MYSVYHVNGVCQCVSSSYVIFRQSDGAQWEVGSAEAIIRRIMAVHWTYIQNRIIRHFLTAIYVYAYYSRIYTVQYLYALYVRTTLMIMHSEVQENQALLHQAEGLLGPRTLETLRRSR